MGVLTGLDPKGVFRYFEEICNIPHGSYNEKEISNYLVAYAKEHDFQYWQDDLYNVVMKVPASKGREEEAPLIMQGHMDMVCEKTADSDFDFEKDGLNLAIDGDYIYAKDTTLGGDDGVAVAFMLAIGDDSTISHPELEFIITVSEEVGMEGASAIDLSMLRGTQMLNLDSEEEGIFLCSCAGGLSAVSKVPVEREAISNATTVDITVEGLQGGHSGCEIDKERGNANILLGRVLNEIMKSCNISLAHIEGGKKDNAIPVLATATLVIEEKDIPDLTKTCDAMNQVLKKEYELSDAKVNVTVSDARKLDQVMVITEKSMKNIISLLMVIPNGVMAMSTSVKGLVETSLNLGILRLEQNELYLQHAIRSSVTSRKFYVYDRVKALIENIGGSCEMQGEYPAWEYKTESAVRPKVIELYKKLYNKEPVMEGIHAGLECGLLAEKIKDLDCVAMGPDILDIHTTAERLSISSTKRVYEFLIEYMK